MTTATRKCMHVKRAKQCVNTRIITCAEVPYSSKKMKIVSRLGFQPGTNIALAIVAVSAIQHPTSSVSGHFIYIPDN